MVGAEDAISLYQTLTSHGILGWVLGGWGIDALLGVQTRPHKDIDLLVLLDDVAPVCASFVHAGFELKEIWSENQWAIDRRELQTLTAFVLQDGHGRELDFHALRLDEHGNGFPTWQVEQGFIFSRQDLSASGTIAGYPVRCITAEKQVLCHMGYQLPEYQAGDLVQLHEKFSLPYPQALSFLGE